MDALVKITRVSDQVGFDPVTLNPLRTKVVTYMVGTHGPFNLVTPLHDFSTEYVERETQKTVDTLRGIGAIA